MSARWLLLSLTFAAAAAGAEELTPPFAQDHILVKPAKNVVRAELVDQHAMLGTRVQQTFPQIGNLQVVRLPDGLSVADAIAAYSGSGLVEYAEPDYIVHADGAPGDVHTDLSSNDPGYADGTLWGLHNTGQSGGVNDADIDAPEGWDIRSGAPNVIVAVIDTGIRYTHQDLAANMWTNPGEVPGNGVDDDGNGYVDDVYGINAITNSGNPFDDNGHGTHCSGTVAARGNNGLGVVGVAWQARIMGCKFLDSTGNGLTSDAIKCVNYARSKGAHVMSNSWGGDAFSQGLSDAVTAARNAGIVFVAAAGNGGTDGIGDNNDSIPNYPSSFTQDNVVAVASTTRTDARSSFSNYGPTSVDLAAPGTSILSTWHIADNAYDTISGTSMATPHVAGALALLRAQYPGDNHLQLIERLYTGVDPIPALAGLCTTGGRLNLRKALAPPPTVSINDVAVLEGNAGTASATFTVSLSAPAFNTVTVNFATADGTATSGDYVPAAGQISFAPGETAKALPIAVNGDLALETDENFFVNLSAPVRATIADGQGLGIIVNDDTPDLFVSDVTVQEGTGGTTNAVFTITASPTPALTVTVNFATANGSATAPSDYTTTTGSRTFPPGVTTQTVSVPIATDSTAELNETFTLNLSAPVNANIADGQGLGTIVNDDFPAASINDVTVTEGDTGTLNATFTVTLSQSAPFASSVNYAAAAGSATVSADFGGVSGTVNFPPGTTSGTIAVPIFADRIFEGNETYTVNLSAPVSATISDSAGLGTITNDDAAGLSIADVVVRERVAPNQAIATFTVTLSPTSGSTETVNWATGNGTATAPADYVTASGTVSFAAGASTQTVNVLVNADALPERMETFEVTLSGSSGPAIAVATATARVLDPPGGADFNGDGLTDILWRHALAGQNVLWYMDGATLLNGTFTNPSSLPDTNWQMVGTNDFNSDGKPDILWRHALSGQNVVWYMDGANLSSGKFLTPAALADTNWKMVGTGDFNVDGKADILWRHAIAGEVVVWFMGGAGGDVLQSGTFLTPRAFANLSWQMVGTGDFNGDGRTDILWRHATSGQNVVWFLNGTSLMNEVFLNPASLPDVNWRMVATGDYNDDGKVDIVFRHAVSGQIVMWFMDGINRISGTFTTPSAVPDLNWKIVGPR